MKSLLLFLSCVIQLAALTRTSSTVNTRSGTIVGSTVYYKEKSVNRFLKIPFAEPPVGDLRFKKPVPIRNWSEPLQADSLPPSCVQYYPYNYPWVDKMSNNSEDCLYLNIWVPEGASQDNPKAVMFWVYSGGFSSGSNRMPVYDGIVLAAEGDVVVVSVNYRLGIFGFLSTGTEDAPGNMGLFDVLEGLKWINNNIEAFGGDKKMITVFGNSAGSITALYLTISPLSTGLLQRVILESGASISNSINDPRVSNLLLGERVAKDVGCSQGLSTLTLNPQKVIACLRKINAQDLAKTVNSFQPSSIITFIPIYGDKFVPIEPYKAVKNGNFKHVDVMAGNVKDEGSIALVTLTPFLSGPYGEKNPKFNKTFGTDVLKNAGNLETLRGIISPLLSNLDDDDYNGIRRQIYHLEGDLMIICPILSFVEEFSKRLNNTYYYYFYHRDLNTVFVPWMGVTHFSEVPFVFGRPLDNPSLYTEAEAKLSLKMIKYWTNFAKNGFPSSKWRKFSGSNPYIKELYVHKTDKNYLKQHLATCALLKPLNDLIL